MRSAGRPRVHAWARFTVGAAGVVTLDEAFSDPGITLGTFSSGVAALSFPSCPKAIVKAFQRPAHLRLGPERHRRHRDAHRPRRR